MVISAFIGVLYFVSTVPYDDQLDRRNSIFPTRVCVRFPIRDVTSVNSVGPVSSGLPICLLHTSLKIYFLHTNILNSVSIYWNILRNVDMNRSVSSRAIKQATSFFFFLHLTVTPP